MSLQLVAFDADGDPLTFSLLHPTLPAGLTLDASTGLITGTPTTAGSAPVFVSVSDGDGGTDGKTFSWTVTAPASGSSVPFVQGAAITSSNTLTDVAVTFVAAQTAGNLNIVVVGWQDDTGAQVNSVSDGWGNFYSLLAPPVTQAGVGTQAIYGAIDIVAAPAGSNQVFVNFTNLVTAADVRVAEYSGVEPANSIDTTASSVGSSSAAGAAHGLSTAHNGDFLVAAVMRPGDPDQPIPSAAGAGFIAQFAAGTGSLLEDAIAPNGSSAHATASLADSTNWLIQVVALRTSDQAPVLGALTNLQSLENTAVSITVMASDPDGDPVTFSATGLPDGAVINPATGVISGTLSFVSAGSFTTTITATDGVLSTSGSFTWIVTNVDRPPTLAVISARTNAEHDSVALQVVGADPDNDPLIFSAMNLPGGLTIDPASGLISGTLTLYQRWHLLCDRVGVGRLARRARHDRGVHVDRDQRRRAAGGHQSRGSDERAWRGQRRCRSSRRIRTATRRHSARPICRPACRSTLPAV